MLFSCPLHSLDRGIEAIFYPEFQRRRLWDKFASTSAFEAMFLVSTTKLSLSMFHWNFPRCT